MSKSVFNHKTRYILPWVAVSLFSVNCFATTTAATTQNTNIGSNTVVATPSVPIPNAVITPTANQQPSVIPQAPNLNANGYVLMDANTGMIIAHKNMHQKMEPASLTKLMTLYLTFQALKNGQIHLTDNVRVSKKAWQTGGSRMFIKEGSEVSVQDLINGVIVASGNDACVALSEYVGGNETTFVDMMNSTAQALGMKDTHFVDSTGLPQPGHETTSYDMALLTHALINNFPEYYPNFKQGWITYNGIKQPNRNRLLWHDTSVDGLKTGHTDEAGFCLIASALRNNMRLISVVMGAPTDSSRANDSEALLNWGFRYYQTHKLFDANQTLITPRIFLGESKTTPVGLAAALYITTPTGSYANLKPEISINKALRAPITKGQVVGTLTIRDNHTVLISAPLIAMQDNKSGGILARLWDHVVMFF